MMNSLANLVAPGVATGDAVKTLFNAAKEGGFAYPAVNAANTNTINATLEAARKVNSPGSAKRASSFKHRIRCDLE